MAWGEEYGVEWGGTAVSYTDVEEYAFVLVQLLPTGEAWAFGDVARPGSVYLGLLRGLAKSAVRVEDRTRDLLAEVDPLTTTELLEDWERVYGLPEDCGTPPTTIEGRRLALLAKMTAKGAGTVPFFLSLAETLGYPAAEVHRMYAPFACGSACTDALYGVEGYWVNTFLLLANATTENDGTLQCLVNAYKQAHEIAIFEAPADWSAPEV